MTSASIGNIENIYLKLITGFLILLPFQWLIILDLGAFAVKMPHVLVLGLIIGAIAGPGGRLRLYKPQPIHLVFVVCAGTLILTLFWTPNYIGGLSYIVRLIVYILISYLAYSLFASLDPRRFAVACAQAVAFAPAVFWLFAIVVFALNGKNIFSVLVGAASSGNPNAVQFFLFRELFNAEQFQSLDAQLQFSAAMRHTIMVSLSIPLVAYIMMRDDSTLRSGIYDIGAVVSMLTVLMSFSRSALFGLICAVILCGVILAAHRRIRLRSGVIALLASGIALAALALPGSAGVRETLFDKFVLDVVNNPRIEAFSAYIGSIGNQPWIGSGAGAAVETSSVTHTRIHNFLLFMWHQAGLLGLTSAGFLVLLMVLTCLNGVRRSCKGDDPSWRVIGLGAALLAVPIVRLMLAGGGELSLGEWIALAVALALLKPGGAGRWVESKAGAQPWTIWKVRGDAPNAAP